MLEDSEFIEMINFVYGKNFLETFDNKHKLYDIYNVLKNDDLDLILLYNKILRIITGDILEDFNYHDVKLFNNLYIYLFFIKELGFEFDEKEFKIKFNFYITKIIPKDVYNEICKYKKMLKTEDQKSLYLYLWNKFLDPTKDKIINRKIKYYESSEEKFGIINENIIDDYISLLSKFNLKKIKNYKENMNVQTIFFGLINEIFH